FVWFETSRSTWAPIFSNGHSSSISLAMLTPSRETIGVPIGRSMIAFIPFGPKVPRTALASLATPRPRAARAASSCSMIFGIGFPHPLTRLNVRRRHDRGRHVRCPRRSRRGLRFGNERRLEVETHRKQTPAQRAVEFGIHTDAPQSRDISCEAVGLELRSRGIDEGRHIFAHRPDDGAPLKIAAHQPSTLVVDR